MLKSIKSITGVGVYKNYEWPDGLAEFAGRNLIYGWNYCGKTTLSRIFRCFELDRFERIPEDSKFKLDTEIGFLGHRDLGSGSGLVIRVFNSDFVEDNLLWGLGAQPLLILGADKILLEDERSELLSKRDAANDWLRRVRVRLDDAERQNETKLSEIAQNVKLKVKLSVFNRSPHLATVLESKKNNLADEVLGEESLARAASIYFSEQKRKINGPVRRKFSSNIPEIYAIFLRTASRDAIETLVGNVRLEQWVRDGIALHGEGEDCKFCGNKISEARWGEIQNHFSKAVKELIGELDASIDSLEKFQKSKLPSSAEFYADLQGRFNELAVSLTRLEERLDERIKEIKFELEKKKSRVEEGYSITRRPVMGLVKRIGLVLDQIEDVVEEHNTRVAEGEEAISRARDALISHYACSGYLNSDIDFRIKKIAFFKRWISRITSAVADIETRLESVENNISAASIGIERVNAIIRLYFGSDRLEVRLFEGRYRVFREGVAAESLSEGEKTAISFAYFMARLEESGLNLSEALVYIDDPVSSLDANHVFNTFSIIKTRLAACAQIFVSTHNYDFFRLMKDDPFFKEWNKKPENRRTSYYQVLRIGDESSLVDLPAALRKYSSEYHLLVATLFEFCDGSGVDSFLIPNILRRLLEAYTSFRFPSAVESLDRRLDLIFENTETSTRVYKLINHLSHSDTVTATFELPSNEEVREVADIVMESLCLFDPDHFDGLKRVLQSE